MAIEAPKFSALIQGTGTTGSTRLRGLITASAYLAPGSSVYGATVAIEKSLNDGQTFFVVPRNESGDPASYTSAFSFLLHEPIEEVLWRFNVTAFSGHPIIVEFR